MMSQDAVIRLILSLSKSEKRQFKIFTKKQSGNKDYLNLFNLIDQKQITDRTILEKKFREAYPNVSLENTSTYLLKVLLDSLIQLRVAGSDTYKLYYGLLRVNILNERNLPAEAFKELNKLKKLSAQIQNLGVQYIVDREILNYLTQNNFDTFSEGDLVTLQAKTRNALQSLRNIHEHYSLYELLKFRLINSGKVLSEKDRRQLNDLLLSEMSIMNARVKHNLESRKIQLLFQSFFFTDTGDYKSAFKTFHELNQLFEKNINLWKNPPFDYFSALDGILDSLRTNGHFTEMNYYIQKLSILANGPYPEYFCSFVTKVKYIYSLAMYIGEGNTQQSLSLITNSSSTLWKEYTWIDEERQRELFFYGSIAWFQIKSYKKAQKLNNEIILKGKVNHLSVVYKAARLLGIIINYELKEMEFLDFEIRSYKRFLQNKSKPLKTEKLVLKAISINPDFNRKVKNDALWRSLSPAIRNIENDRYELQLRKYFDFVKWVKEKFGK